MHLKSIELRGFKSFADPMSFDFSKGISAIVGPNGSGKSNIVDAIRWVLGEQSAKSLRGGKMEDVIFSGSTLRKPVGLARVTIILDNAERQLPVEGDEVEVQRTLHRSGESEYRINRKNCRLKDIHELFMDTGIGRDGFSVIGQGKIDEILIQHAEERRGLIEEAAGISKYKYRKREAERKLQATRDDMERLEDILFELEERLAPLSIQAEKVLRYREIKEKEDALQLAVWAKNVRRLEDRVQSAQVQFDEIQDSETVLSTNLQQAEADRMTVLAQKEALNPKMQEAQQQVIQTGRHLEALEGRLEVVKAKLAHMAEQTAVNHEAIVRLNQQETDRQAEVAEEEAKHLQANDAWMQLQEELSDQQEKLAVMDKQWETDKEDLADAKNTQFEQLSHRADLHNERTKWQQALSGHQFRRQKTGERIAGLKERHQTITRQIAETHQAASEETEKLQKLDDTLRDLQARIQKQNTAIDAEQQTLAKIQADVQKYQSRADTLEELETSGEGYFAGVQAVLQARQNGELNGIHGSVAQLLEIPDRFLTAMENALGATTQNIVAGTDLDASAAIQWLKSGQRGRVTFMPLNTIKGEKSHHKPKGNGIIGLAADLIACDPTYQSIANHLLGRIWVVEDLEKARRIAKENQFKVRLVTLDGDILSPGGTMSGGRNKKQTPLLRRRKDMQALAERISRLKKEGASHTERLQTLLTEQAAQQHKLEKILEDRQSGRIILSEKDTLRGQLEAQAAQLQKELDLEAQDENALGSDLETADLRLSEIAQAIETAETALVSLDETVTTLQNRVDATESERQQLADAVQDLRVQAAQKKEKHSHNQQQLVRLRNEYNQTVSALSEARNKQARLLQEKETLEQEKKHVEQAQKDNEGRYRTEEKTLASLQAQMADLDHAVLTGESTLKDLREKLKSCQTDLMKHAGLLEKNRLQLEHIETALMDQMALSVQDALQNADETIDTTRSGERLQDMRRARAELGELNFTAVEEHQQVLARSQFLSAQLSDLTAAKNKLETIIKEMETTMSRRFKATYERVNEQFGKIFMNMFDGGQAELALSIPGNYLETGVEIIAQPPGKKASILTLLSGGERAMTAIALLFALQEVRPSPFVILDEIEAALDEANIDRFAGFLKQYATDTQFIIISHRRGTMEAASVLYGVTMDKGGVSKQVSVRLTGYEEDESDGLL